jgi:hypothetical protein
VQELLNFLERVGIPAGIAILVLLRIEPRLDALTKAVLELPNHLHICACDTTSTQDGKEPRT